MTSPQLVLVLRQGLPWEGITAWAQPGLTGALAWQQHLSMGGGLEGTASAWDQKRHQKAKTSHPASITLPRSQDIQWH